MLKTGIVEDAFFLIARTQRHQGWHRGTAWQSIKSSPLLSISPVLFAYF